MLPKMDFKFLILVACMAVFSDALKRFPMYAKKLSKEEKQFLSVQPPSVGGITYKDYALMIDVSIKEDNKDVGTYNFVLDSTSDYSWIVSQSYSGKYGKTVSNGKVVPKSSVTGDSSTVTVSEDGRIEGKTCSNCIITMTEEKKGEKPNTLFSSKYDLLAADTIDGELLKKLPSESAGVIGLKDVALFEPSLAPEVYVSLFVNPWKIEDSKFFIGVPDDYILHPNSKLRYLTSSSERHWNFDLQYISSTEGGWRMWSVGGADAILDMSYSGIRGPAKDIKSINEFIGADEDGNIDCEKIRWLQPLAFHMGGASYNLNPRNYIKQGEDKFDRKCKSVFEVEHTYNDAWRLGLAFMKQYLTVFHLNKDAPVVSFAPLDIKNIIKDLSKKTNN